MAISQMVGAYPARTQQQTDFDDAMARLMVFLPSFINDTNATGALISLIAAGTATALAYTFDATTADADPGPGFFRLSASPQNTSTTLRLDLLGADGSSYGSLIDTFALSTSAVKGQLRLVKAADPSKWLVFNVTAVASPTGYKNVNISNTASSAASPFVAGDSVLMLFTRTGDLGGPGTILRRTLSITSSATPTPDASNTDLYIITALATAPTFGAPTNTPLDGQGLMFRVKDNGTARALAFNAIYRAGTDLALPSATIISKTLYIGVVYNAADIKWDLVAVLYI
jgi:hypothetical protein